MSIVHFGKSNGFIAEMATEIEFNSSHHVPMTLSFIERYDFRASYNPISQVPTKGRRLFSRYVSQLLRDAQEVVRAFPEV